MPTKKELQERIKKLEYENMVLNVNWTTANELLNEAMALLKKRDLEIKKLKK
jgi:exonuclease VII small subunit|tara:strand:- start:4990 stop:5145 length:156 start_codon:yes stop_codon:yes gene_type:complete